MIGRHPGERDDQRREVLAGLDGADEREVRRDDPERGEPGAVVGLVGIGTEALGVDAVVDHHRPRRGRAPPRAGGCAVVSLTQTITARARRRSTMAAAEEQHLGPLVPLGMVEEREVVHGDDGGHAEPGRHRVVRTVPDVGAEPGRELEVRGPAPRRVAADVPVGTTAWTSAAGRWRASAGRRRGAATSTSSRSSRRAS